MILPDEGMPNIPYWYLVDVGLSGGVRPDTIFKKWLN